MNGKSGKKRLPHLKLFGPLVLNVAWSVASLLLVLISALSLPAGGAGMVPDNSATVEIHPVSSGQEIGLRLKFFGGYGAPPGLDERYPQLVRSKWFVTRVDAYRLTADGLQRTTTAGGRAD